MINQNNTVHHVEIKREQTEGVTNIPVFHEKAFNPTTDIPSLDQNPYIHKSSQSKYNGSPTIDHNSSSLSENRFIPDNELTQEIDIDAILALEPTPEETSAEMDEEMVEDVFAHRNENPT